MIQVEAGNFLLESTNYLGQMPPAALLQNEQVVRAYSRWPVDVINLGRPDLLYSQKLFASDGLPDRLSSLPVIKNIISANGLFQRDATAPAAYIVKEVYGPRISLNRKKRIKVGFVGLAEPRKMSEGSDGAVTDMFTAARRVVPKVRAECDLLVIVAHSEFDTALRLARENPEADVIIAGNAGVVFSPETVGKTLVVCAAPGNTQEGDLRVYVAKDGRISFKFRSTDLDALVPADAAALAYTKAAREEINKLGWTMHYR